GREVGEQGLADLIVEDLDAPGVRTAARADPLERPQAIERAAELAGIELGEAAELGRIERTIGDRQHSQRRALGRVELLQLGPQALAERRDLADLEAGGRAQQHVEEERVAA